MKLPLSKRLLACCDFVAKGDRVADIGCDHGYLGIYLLTADTASSVIAADVKEQPLQCAMRNSVKYGVGEKMRFYLSDGVRGIPHDFDTLVCAGMGADTMIAILEAAPWLKTDDYRLILQCQSKQPLLRRYLSEAGWQITAERALRDGRFLYTVMEVRWQQGKPLTPSQWYFSPALLDDPTKETGEYYRQVIKRLRLAAQHDPALSAVLAELENDPDFSFLKEGYL